MNASSYYLTEVLGVKNYLCPQEIHSFRRLKGPLPCDILILMEGTPSAEAHQLLKKIMTAIGVSDFSLLEVRDLSRVSDIRHFLLSEKPAKKTLIFSSQLSSLFEDSEAILTSCNLEDLLTGDTAKKKKMELWARLKKWKS